MSKYVAAPLRSLVAQRAHFACEYCRIHEDDTFFGCQMEHIIAEKHGGPTSQENLAYACIYCNANKGTDFATIDSDSGRITQLFNPRSDRWDDHFVLAESGASIIARSEVGAVTIRLLKMNASERIAERALLCKLGRYPAVQG
jgi:hypothetical protein